VIAGDGPLRADLEADGDARIHFLGRVDDVRPVISAADVVVSCSKREGLPRSLLESLAGATPIISSSCRGSEDLAAVPEAVFDVGNPSALSDLLNRTLPDPEMLQRILRAQTKHLERFSFAGVADAQRKVYEDLLTR
jgi:glycosyltransferase involved in cell wall biosynthesis